MRIAPTHPRRRLRNPELLTAKDWRFLLTTSNVGPNVPSPIQGPEIGHSALPGPPLVPSQSLLGTAAPPRHPLGPSWSLLGHSVPPISFPVSSLLGVQPSVAHHGALSSIPLHAPPPRSTCLSIPFIFYQCIPTKRVLPSGYFPSRSINSNCAVAEPPQPAPQATCQPIAGPPQPPKPCQICGLVVANRACLLCGIR